MRVRVRALGVLKKALGKDELLLDLDSRGELKLRDVIERILWEAASLRDLLLDSDLKDPRPNTIILINGKEMGLLGGLDAIIRDGDEIVLIPVVHGG
ncbi:MAG: MoaD/ThiS family protein [Candidatus Bathyarchaeia archaeon]